MQNNHKISALLIFCNKKTTAYLLNRGGETLACIAAVRYALEFVQMVICTNVNLNQRWQRIRSGADPDIRVFLRIRIQFFSKKRIWIGSGSEFVSAPGNDLETKSALHFAETLGIHLKFGRKNAPILSEVLFFVSLFLLWSSTKIGKNAQLKYCCAAWWWGSYQSIHKVQCTTVLNYRET